jgi:hypothetical protein
MNPFVMDHYTEVLLGLLHGSSFLEAERMNYPLHLLTEASCLNPLTVETRDLSSKETAALFDGEGAVTEQIP